MLLGRASWLPHFPCHFCWRSLTNNKNGFRRAARAAIYADLSMCIFSSPFFYLGLNWKVKHMQGGVHIPSSQSSLRTHCDQPWMNPRTVSPLFPLLFWIWIQKCSGSQRETDSSLKCCLQIQFYNWNLAKSKTTDILQGWGTVYLNFIMVILLSGHVEPPACYIYDIVALVSMERTVT